MVSQEVITKKCSRTNQMCNCKKRRWPWFLLFLIIILLIVFFLWRSGSELGRGFLLGGEAIEEYKLVREVREDMIEVPGLMREYLVDKNNRELYLVNPKGNSVYFKYIISNEKGDILYQTNYIPPDKMERANLYDVLKSGEYKLLVKVETVDMESGSACNFVQMQTNVIVNN